MSEESELDLENKAHMLEQEVNPSKVKTDLNENLESNKIYKAVVFINKEEGKVVDEHTGNQNLTINELESVTNCKAAIETDFDNKLTETIAYQQKIIEQNNERIKNVEEKCTYLEQQRKEFISQLEQVTVF